MPLVNGDVTINVELEVEVFCAGCGAGLCKQSKAGNTNYRKQTFIEVEPCEKCLEKARDEGRQEVTP